MNMSDAATCQAVRDVLPGMLGCMSNGTCQAFRGKSLKNDRDEKRMSQCNIAYNTSYNIWNGTAERRGGARAQWDAHL